MNLFLNLAFKRLNLMRFLMSIRLLHVLAELTTLPFFKPTVQRTFRLIRLPDLAQTTLVSTTICILFWYVGNHIPQHGQQTYNNRSCTCDHDFKLLIFGST